MLPDKKLGSDQFCKFPFFLTGNQSRGDTNHHPVGF